MAGPEVVDKLPWGAEIRPRVGQTNTNLGRSLADAGQTLVDVDQAVANFEQHRVSYGQYLDNVGRSRPALSNFGRCLIDVAQR